MFNKNYYYYYHYYYYYYYYYQVSHLQRCFRTGRRPHGLLGCWLGGWSIVAPVYQHIVGAKPLGACSISEGRDVTMLKHQEASVRNHGAVVNTVTVIGRVSRAAALLCHD